MVEMIRVRIPFGSCEEATDWLRDNHSRNGWFVKRSWAFEDRYCDVIFDPIIARPAMLFKLTFGGTLLISASARTLDHQTILLTGREAGY